MPSLPSASACLFARPFSRVGSSVQSMQASSQSWSKMVKGRRAMAST